MEYLMTYGWAILIIAVVLGALYYLGVFNSSNLAPRAQPGSCKVVRPNGPGTTTYINLAGICTGQLPLFVGSFDGQSSYVNLGRINQEAGTNSISFAVWFKTPSSTPNTNSRIFGDSVGSPRYGYALYFNPSNYLSIMRWADSASPTTGTSNPISLNQWYSAAVTYNGYVMSLYLNGVLQSSIAATNSLILNEPMTLGTDSGVQYFWNSQIADFQIYNTSLSTAEVQGLYAEGMGGAPTRLQNLVGWWPLNGNANDYSGNGNNGAATSVLYTSAWTK